jgi:hypothetical protein
MFAGNDIAYLIQAPYGAPLLGRLLALPTIIRLGWKGLPWKNTLAYHKITAVKSFIGFSADDLILQIHFPRSRSTKPYDPIFLIQINQTL